MKKLIVGLIFSAAFLTGCGSDNSVSNHISKHDSVLMDTVGKAKLADSLHLKHLLDSIAAIVRFPKEYHDSLFSYEITYDSTKDGIGNWNHYITSVKISRLSDHKKIQTVFPEDQYLLNIYTAPFQMEDMNFDGYDDFRIPSITMMRGQQFYLFWLYNPVKERFEENAQLEETWDVEFDHAEKTVTSNARTVGPFGVVNKVFTWENGKMILRHKEECEEDAVWVGGLITMNRRVNGKMIKRSRYYDTIPFTREGQAIFEWDSLK